MVYVCNAMRRKLANDAYEAKHPELGGERARYRDAAVRAMADMRKRFPNLTAENFDEADEYRKTRISQLTSEERPMQNLGFGAMMHILGGGSEHSASEYYGQRIDEAEMKEERLRLKLSGGKIIEIWDDAQSCCESRYITTDDDLATIIGGILVRIEAKDGPNIPDEYGEHEQVFVEVGTDKGFITLVNHNEHNGYYGGFGLTITETSE